VIDLRTWADTAPVRDRPWLLLGKGPSFSLHAELDLAPYHLFGLNHVVREIPVDVAHAIDVDVAATCADAIRTNSRWLMMPRRPHVDFKPADRLLEDFFDDVPLLAELSEQGRLVWYDLCNSPPVGDGPIIRVRWFSSEAALSILAASGVKTIRSLGVDGGRGYSAAFNDLEQTTMLANGHPSFDRQFSEMEAIVTENSLDYAPLTDDGREPMRVFVGADETQLVAAAVLEHSIRKHATGPVDFNVMIDLDVPEPRDPANRARTGFSFYRFMIPRLCDYRGRALYLDCDMQVFADLAELWQIPFDDTRVLCTNQPAPPEKWKDDPNFKPGRHLAVMMLDCSALHWDIDEIIAGLDEGRYDYKQLMSDLCIVQPEQIDERIQTEWNHLEQYVPGVTKLLHYTIVPTQPWKNDKNPLADLWLEGFRAAARDNAVSEDMLRSSVEKGFAKRSLLDEFERVRAGRAGDGAKSEGVAQPSLWKRLRDKVGTQE
jgi:Glycosyl transferase family 8